jgi:uncharacterized membrane protein YedE/YeeE
VVVDGEEMMVYGTVILACLGLLIGYLAQRSRMCFVAGVRDYILVRDSELVLGLVSFILTIWVLTSVLYPLGVLRSTTPQYGQPSLGRSVEKLGLLPDLNTGSVSTLFREGGGQLRAVLTGRFFYVTIGGGLILGAVSTMAGGCVLRQHVLLAQGNGDALFFILGFYAAVVVYYGLLFKFFVRLY